MTSRLLTLRAAASFCSLSERTIKRMIARGLPVYRPSPGGKILIKPEDLDAYMMRQQAQPVNVLDDLLEELKPRRSNGKAGPCVQQDQPRTEKERTR
jgi:excisionase family DNA binding protein